MKIDSVSPKVFAPYVVSTFVIYGSDFEQGLTVKIADKSCEAISITETRIDAKSPADLTESDKGQKPLVITKDASTATVDVYVTDLHYRVLRALEPPIGLKQDGLYDKYCRILALAFDREFFEVESSTDEMFAETALDELAHWERLYALAVNPSLSIDERRARVISRRDAQHGISAHLILSAIYPYFGMTQDELEHGGLYCEEASSYAAYGDEYWAYTIWWARLYYTSFNEPLGALPEGWTGTGKIEEFEPGTCALKLDTGEYVEREIEWNGLMAFWVIRFYLPANQNVPLHVYLKAGDANLVWLKFDTDGLLKIKRADGSWTSVAPYSAGQWLFLAMLVCTDIGYCYFVGSEIYWYELLAENAPTKIRFESEEAAWIQWQTLIIGYAPTDLPYEDVKTHLQNISPGYVRPDLGWILLCDVGRTEQDFLWRNTEGGG